MGRHQRHIGACLIAALLLSAPAAGYTPGSGDVDEDGRQTPRDAVRAIRPLRRSGGGTLSD